MRYAKRGEGGETVILIHGFGGDLDNWLFNIDALAENATVYALDLPGHGQSVKALDKPSLAAMTAALSGFMDTVGISGAHLVGHSMGGAIAMQMANDQPGKVKSMTLICSAGLGSEISDYTQQFIGAQGRKDLKPALETAVCRQESGKPPIGRRCAQIQASRRRGRRSEGPERGAFRRRQAA